MTGALKGKLVAGFILAFVAGGATGAFFALHHARDWRRHFGHHPHSLVDGMRERLTSQLDLTPEQVAKITPILDDASQKLQKIRSETGTEVRQVMQETNQALQPLLSEQQRARLQRLEPRGHFRPGPRRMRRHPRADAEEEKNGE
jgi:Spy/CpxP family protein refolding chaperone